MSNNTMLPLTSQLQVNVAQSSIAGVKPQNEDAIGIRIPEGELLATKGVVAVIADGVSAADHGKEAAEASIQNFISDYYATPDAWSVKKSGLQVLISLNRWLYGQGQRLIDAQKGYICTLSILIIKSHTAHIFHVGDSRIYRLRGQELEQLTRDHATDIGKGQSYLTRSMGLDLHLDVDYKTFDVNQDDVFMLSTDGVHDFVKFADLQQQLVKTALDSDKACEQCCEQLLEQALENQSRDNLSCQLLRIQQMPLADSKETYKNLTELPFPPDLRPGLILDGYRVEREIHASNRSQLYVVEDVESGERLVMKTPSVNYQDDAAYIERFVMESWICARLNSPHIVKVIAPRRPRQFLYYLTEYVDGQSLQQWIKENPKPPVQEVVYLLEQIGKGLRSMHRKEIIHQDLKPDNIMISRDGVVKLIDFGACYVAGVAEIATPFMRDKALGTADYSAPEVAMAKSVCVQSDIFSLGVIAFQMLTGQLPFSGKLSQCRTPLKFQNLRYVAAYRLNPLVPIWVDSALRKSLIYQPSQRYGEVAELIHELQNPGVNHRKMQKGPLMERNPLRFWQSVAAILLITQLATILFMR